MRSPQSSFAVLAALTVVGSVSGGVVGAMLLSPPEAKADLVKPGVQPPARPIPALQAIPPAPTEALVGDDGFVFRRKDGTVVAKLGVDASGGVLEVFGAARKPKFRVRSTPDGGGEVELLNDNSPAHVLSTTASRVGSVETKNADGKTSTLTFGAKRNMCALVTSAGEIRKSTTYDAYPICLGDPNSR